MTFDEFLREACADLDLAWRKYRRRSARHRLDERLRELGLDDYRAYLERLRTEPSEAAGLADLLRVTVSRFFRERGCWRDLSKIVLPALIAKRQTGSLHIWSAGCCGGEEPYTVVLVWLDYLQPLHPALEVEILATDIDETSLARARQHSYSAGSLREVPPELLDRWFCSENGLWRLDERVTGLVDFKVHNLMTDPPPKGVDLALCRYLAFTYYRGSRLLSATTRLWEALRPGGALMIGKKEGIPPAALEYFEPWPGCAGVYRRRG